MDWFNKANSIIKANGIILTPTDTVWGLSGRALSNQAIEQAYNIKQRPKQKSFIVLMHSIAQLKQFVLDDLEPIQNFLENTDRPTTVIYNQTKHLPAELLAANGSIAIRIPKENWLLDFLKVIDEPIISTSANISGETTAKFFNEVSDKIKEQVEFIVPFEPEKSENQSSQIIRFINGQVNWLRK